MNAGMHLFKRGEIYGSSWAGKKISLRTRDKAQAQAAFNRLKRACFRQHLAVLEGRPACGWGTSSGISGVPRPRKALHLRGRPSGLRHLLAEFGPKKLLKQISSLDLEKFLGRLKATGLRDTSLAVYYRHLKAAFASLTLEIHPGKPLCRDQGAQGQKSCPGICPRRRSCGSWLPRLTPPSTACGVSTYGPGFAARGPGYHLGGRQPQYRTHTGTPHQKPQGPLGADLPRNHQDP